jgi:hypothetical protein
MTIIKNIDDFNQIKKAQKYISDYLTSHYIEFKEIIEGSISQCMIIYKNCYGCPDNILESSICFHPNCMECRVYFDENAANWCKNSEHLDDFMHLLNYINATLWPQVCDGIGEKLYENQHLYTPRLYMTEDGYFDITMTVVVPYDFFEVAPLETLDFLTGTCTHIMDTLSPSIFCLLLGVLNLEDAKMNVKNNFLN